MELATVGTPALWGAFFLFVLVMLALDLGVFHRKAHVIAPKEALTWSGIWVGLALLFAAFVWGRFGPQAGMEFLTGYVVEKSLSVDNIFVFIVIFSALRIPPLHQHRVLFWGILTALVLRAAMIFAGAALLTRFHWLMYVFGAFLVFTGVKLYRDRNVEDTHPEQSALARWVKKVIPFTDKLDAGHFVTVENGKRVATPLLMALMLVEVTDVIFAVDSIPAVFAVTLDPFIVFTSNIFAILGLRSLFFLVSGAVEKFTYLKVGLSLVLMFVGLKMTLVDWVKVPAAVSLLVIVALLGGAIFFSIRKAAAAQPPSRAPS